MATFINQATLSYNNTITTSNVVQGEVLDRLSGTKTAVMDDYVRGDDVTYVISLVNTGNTPDTNVTVTDDLGAYTWENMTLYPLTYVENSLRYYLNGELQTPPTVTANGQLVISGLTIPADGNAMLIYEADANQFAPLDVDASITNTAVVTQGTGLAPLLTLTETISTEDAPQLTITKSISPVPIQNNETLTYTFTLQNHGNTPAVATDDAIITDTFDPILSSLSVSFNGTLWTQGTQYTYNAATGEFATVAGQITVPAATFTRDETTGAIIVNPGVSTLVVSGQI